MNMKITKVAVGALLLAALGLGIRGIRADGKAPAVGSPAPDFMLNSQESKSVSLHDFKGKWVVLYFYPKDFTSGCTVEAHNFQRDLPQYEQRNAVIIGVSVQDEVSHQKFCTKEGLSFKLLADTKQEVSTEYDSVMTYNGAKFSARHTFTIARRHRLQIERRRSARFLKRALGFICPVDGSQRAALESQAQSTPV